jgi:stress-induced-phosphoprotein 1
MQDLWLTFENTLFFCSRSEGNQFFKTGDYKNAIIKYGEAIAIDPSQTAYWSNRSASHAGLNQWEEARDDAKQCITVDKSFVKGYFRLATAQKALNDLEGARDTLNRGLSVEPRNADLKKNLKVSTSTPHQLFS